MSVEAMALVLHHSQAQGTAKVVLLGIANHDGDGGAWPTVRTLCKYARRSESTVQEAIQRLVRSGELRVHVNGGGTASTRSDRRPNRYEILLACPPECDGTTNHGVQEPGPGEADGVQEPGRRGPGSQAHGVQEPGPEPPVQPPLEPPPAEGPSLSSVAFAVAREVNARPGVSGANRNTRRVARAVLEVLEGSGHYSQEEVRAGVTQVLEEGLTVTTGSLALACSKARQARTEERRRVEDDEERRRRRSRGYGDPEGREDE